MNLTDLGRRAVACKHWRWMPGMLASDPGGNRHRIVCHDAGKKYAQTVLQDYDDAHVDSSVPVDGVIPALSDPATLGCLLHLVREAWGDSDLSADRVSRAHDKLQDVWQIYVFHESGVKDVLSGHSEVAALVAALQAAP